MEDIKWLKTRSMKREKEREEALGGLEGIGYLHRKENMADRLQRGLGRAVELSEKVGEGARRIQAKAAPYARKSAYSQSIFSKGSILTRMTRRYK